MLSFDHNRTQSCKIQIKLSTKKSFFKQNTDIYLSLLCVSWDCLTHLYFGKKTRTALMIIRVVLPYIDFIYELRQ